MHVHCLSTCAHFYPDHWNDDPGRCGSAGNKTLLIKCLHITSISPRQLFVISVTYSDKDGGPLLKFILCCLAHTGKSSFIRVDVFTAGLFFSAGIKILRLTEDNISRYDGQRLPVTAENTQQAGSVTFLNNATPLMTLYVTAALTVEPVPVVEPEPVWCLRHLTQSTTPCRHQSGTWKAFHVTHCQGKKNPATPPPPQRITFKTKMMVRRNTICRHRRGPQTAHLAVELFPLHIPMKMVF